MRLFLALGFGVLFGLLVSVMVSFSIWLDMRIHSYHIVWIGITLGFVLCKYLKFKHYIVVQILLLILAIYGKTSTILYNFKESFFIPSIDMSVFIFLGFIICLNLILFIRRKYEI